MRLRALDLYRVPGIERPFRVVAATEPGVVNLVTGPNASGKSTLLRAIRGLLYPKQYTSYAWQLRGELVDEAGYAMEVVNSGGVTTWSDGRDTIDPPALPEARFASCYMLEFEDLAGPQGESEAALARRIANDLTGGYDLKAVRERFPAKLSQARSPATELDTAERERADVQRKRNDLRQQEARLADLRAELATAETTAAELGPIDDAQAYRRAQRQLEAINAQLAAMPAGMARLTGDDVDTLARIDEALTAANQREHEANKQYQDAEQRLAASGLRDSALAVEQLADPRDQARAMGRAEDRLVQANEQLAQQRAALAERTRQLGGDPDNDPGPLTPDAVRRASQSLDTRREQKARERQLELAREGLPADDEVTEATDALAEARHALRQWLAAAADAERRARPWVDWLLLGVPLTVASGAAAVRIHAAFLALAVVALAGVGFRWWRLAPAAPARTAEQRFRASNVAQPSSWTRAAVEARLAEIESELADAEQKRRRAEQRREVERALERQRTAIREAENDLAAQAASLGFDPRQLDEGLTAWLETLRSYHDQRQRLADAQAEVQHLQQDLAAKRSAVVAFLDAYDEAPNEDAPSSTTLETALDRLHNRLEQRDTAARKRDTASQDSERARAERERLTGQRQQFFERRELTDGDEAGLRHRLDRLADWRELTSQREQTTGEVNLARQRLAGETNEPSSLADELMALADRDAEDELERRRERAQQANERADQCRNEIARIQAEIQQARSERRLEEAEARVQQARDQLEDCLEKGLRECAGAFLVADVEHQVQELQRPAALAQAQSWFAAFTGYRHELQLQPGDPPAFTARETATGHDHPLSELSSGTRMQLLLAARLGFAVYAEGERGKLPLFLDHALATTDPERFAAVARTLQQVASTEGRQVFYLTADPAEVARWQHALGQEAVHEIDVAAIREETQRLPDPAAALDQEPTALPSPDDIGEDAFFDRLAVPAIDPWQGAEAVHLAYLLRDAPVLVHRLAAMGMERAGQVRNFLERHGGEGVLDADERRLVEGRLTGCAAWVEAWCQGRGAPLGPEILGDPECPVSPDRTTKYEEIAATAEAQAGDPQALLSELRSGAVKRLQTRLIDSLEEHLQDLGYLPSLSPLTAGERRQRVAEALSHHMDAVDAGSIADALVARLEAGVAASHTGSVGDAVTGG